MKNIHLLPTDKPSRLYYHKLLQSLQFSKDIPMGHNGVEVLIALKNICITNSEEIKEGDYYINLQNKPYINRSGKTKFKGLYDNCKKIILTDIKDLIADGIQAIDDEFLEFIVKNPSCEEVEITEFITQGKISGKLVYKIIIPKEEPKQRNTLLKHQRL